MNKLNQFYSINSCANCQSNNFHHDKWNKYNTAKCIDCDSYVAYYLDDQIHTVKIMLDNKHDAVISQKISQFIKFSNKEIVNGEPVYMLEDEVIIKEPIFINKERFKNLSIFK